VIRIKPKVDGITVPKFLAILEFSERIEEEVLPMGIGELRDASAPRGWCAALNCSARRRNSSITPAAAHLFHCAAMVYMFAGPGYWPMSCQLRLYDRLCRKPAVHAQQHLGVDKHESEMELVGDGQSNSHPLSVGQGPSPHTLAQWAPMES
jgi:hypothetical protein